MSDFSQAGRDAFRRASERARAVLKKGDRLLMDGCGGKRSTVTFREWTDGWGNPKPDSDYFSSTTLDDLHPWNIVKINGEPVSFRDPEGEAAVERDTAPIRAISVQRRRRMFRSVETSGQPA